MKKSLLSKIVLTCLAPLTVIASADDYSDGGLPDISKKTEVTKDYVGKINGWGYRGKILKTSFYPKADLLGSDRFNALVNIGQDTVVTNTIYSDEAREANLRYNEGDFAKISPVTSGNKIYWLIAKDDLDLTEDLFNDFIK